jgi:hypothetical protein
MQANASILQVTITWGVCTCDICIDVFICSPIYATILAPPPAVYTVALRCDWPIKITQIQITNLVIFYHWLGPPVSLGLYVTLQRYLGFLYQMWLCRAQVEQYTVTASHWGPNGSELFPEWCCLYILDHHKTFLVHLLLTDTLQTNAILSCPNLPLTFEVSLFHTFVLAVLIKSVSSANVQYMYLC